MDKIGIESEERLFSTHYSALYVGVIFDISF